jgi:two-component system, OmpR family, response regulator
MKVGGKNMAKGEKKTRIFSASEVANICGVVNQTAINWIRNGHLKAFTTPGGQFRVYTEDLADFLEKRGMRLPPDLEKEDKYKVDWNSILIVDDDIELNGMIKKFLDKKLEGFTVIQAFDGFEAGKLLSEKRPGFVLMDIGLPGVDGHKLCSRIKEDEILGKPFVIAMTGMDPEEHRARIISEGADAFFPKPLDLGELYGSIVAFSSKVKE